MFSGILPTKIADFDHRLIAQFSFQAVEGALLAAFLVFLAGPIMALRLPMGRRSALTRSTGPKWGLVI